MAAASYQYHQYQYHDHRPLTILNRDDNSFIRFKSQTIAKRKSAVELLQETKPLYVKSEIILDRKQELRRNLRSYQSSNSDGDLFPNDSNNGLLHKVNSSTSPLFNIYVSQNNSANGGTNVSFPLPKSPRLIPPPPAFRKSTSSLQLQNKLRKLLNADSKENLLEANSVAANSEPTSTVNKNAKYECNSSKLDFANNDHVNNQTSNLNVHKSLPDLTNIHDLSTRNDEQLDYGSCYCNPGSTCSDGNCKRSTHTACISLASCKNDCLHASTDYCDGQSSKDLKNDTDNAHKRGNSLPTSPVKSCTSYITPPSLYCDTSDLLKNRPVLRSKSDVGVRNLSSLQPVDIPLSDSASLNMFFDNLGLKSEEYSSLTAPRSNASSPVYMNSSISSLDSVGDRGSGSDNLSINHTIDSSPSIVERNARIIKWLCNCRKALEQVPRLATLQSR